METTIDDVTEPPTHRLARETYNPDRLPDFDVFSAVVDLSADSIEAASGVDA